MIKIVLIGGGNLAYHLANQIIVSKGLQLVQIYNRNLAKIEIFNSVTKITNDLNELRDADIYIIAISDNSISSFSKKLNLQNKLVVHTSGAMSLNNLKSNSNKGVFYPLQSFSKNKKINFSNVPICIEAENKEDYNLLERLAKQINSPVYKVTSEKREKLHVAAVFVNNFTNHLYHLGEEICLEEKLPFEILKPLIKETSNKIKRLSPKEVQTGPARRNDTETIDKHLELLTQNKQEIYKLLSNSIAKTYGKKL
jgi:predicted short-subunit dehydrogenase-like oxidoreductase (DUF2520 family)